IIRRPPRSTRSSSSAASDVYKRQGVRAAGQVHWQLPPVLGSARPQQQPRSSVFMTCAARTRRDRQLLSSKLNSAALSESVTRCGSITACLTRGAEAPRHEDVAAAAAAAILRQRAHSMCIKSQKRYTTFIIEAELCCSQRHHATT